MDLVRKNLMPSQIMTRPAFENAIASVAASGGSTNAVLHLLALAREANVALQIDEFDTISARTPTIATLKPGGLYTAVEMHQAGGISLLLRRLLEGGLLHQDCLTVTGRTIAQEVASAPETTGQQVIRPTHKPFKATGDLSFYTVIWRKRAGCLKLPVAPSRISVAPPEFLTTRKMPWLR